MLILKFGCAKLCSGDRAAVEQARVPDAVVRVRGRRDPGGHQRGVGGVRREAGAGGRAAAQPHLLLLLAHDQGAGGQHAAAGRLPREEHPPHRLREADGRARTARRRVRQVRRRRRHGQHPARPRPQAARPRPSHALHARRTRAQLPQLLHGPTGEKRPVLKYS